ncbi:hypothetical protein [Alkanindiges illinoisensis]|uniref:Uncharacterized protein n=1 Tax=Alkanindiges illinoisensis TaxID=197183 RepID=A0A4Y7X8V5_9GAMM|nr:hypothetical protein [Alkanindiges illinoisensis]TEU23377.1 hypothetical protein E2B99_13760 [Alkanindiges illinoisensis]
MPFYAPPLYRNVNVRLEGGYIPPNAVGGVKNLSSAGRYDYKPSHYNNVNARLLSGYILPNPVEQSKILTRTEYSGALPQTISVSGEDYLEIGNSRADLKILYLVPIGVEYPSIGSAHIRNRSEKVYVNHNYAPPTSTQVTLSANHQTSTSAYLTRPGNYNVFGFLSISNKNRVVATEGKDLSDFGSPKLILAERKIVASGFVASGIGTPFVQDTAVKPSGIDSLIFSKPTIYNLRQYVKNRGIPPFELGIAYLQGGVKYITASGFSSNVFGATTVINTRADQYLQLSGEGITPPLLASPNVSPRILYPSGIKADAYGQPLVQRNPSPLGFVDTSYGDAWVSHSPRYLLAGIGDSFVSGYPQVFDPTRTIYLADKGIEGGIFGDTAAKNTRRIITVDGFQDSQFSSFATIYSTRRYINTIGFDAQNFGNSEIYNKTPSLAPNGFDSLQGLNPSIGYAIRHIYPSGFDLLKTGNAVVIKTPEIKPGGFNAQAFGALFISNYTRLIEVAGKYSQEFGEPAAWHRLRKLQHEGFTTDSYGKPRIEHGRRTLLALGSNHSLYGQPWLSYAIRSIAVRSIYTEFASNHNVGGLQFIDAQGFIATEFGTRIIPEVQSLAPFGFSNSYGLATIDLKTKYIAPQGFKTSIQESLRFGTPKFYNLVQYITQNYDAGSGLVPPQWPQWTAIENRNKIIGAIGSNFTKVGEPNLYNNARLIEPSGIDSFKHSGLLIADRIRYLRLEGMEPPYISGWSNVHNDARVIQVGGFSTQVFGSATIENTRRYYPRVGNWESLEFGTPMVADAIRTIDIESRYGINPPYIPVPDIQLRRRYLDEVGKDDHLRMGEPSLIIHFNIIAPRWSQVDRFGEPRLVNVTPEVHTYGHNSELFGNASARTSFRVVEPDGSLMELFGLTGIADRNRAVIVSSFNAGAIGSAIKVIKTGQPPYTPQYIWLDEAEIDGVSSGGYGIDVPKTQVSNPFVRSNVISPEGFVATRSGSHHLQSNGIIVDIGVPSAPFGSANVGLKNRPFSIGTIGDSMLFGFPSLSPHTIYATKDVTQQAITNHPLSSIFYDVGSSPGISPAGERFGNITLTLQHRTILRCGAGSQLSIGSANIRLTKRLIDLNNNGFRSYRTGFHSVGPFELTLIQYDSIDSAAFGATSIIQPTATKTVRAIGGYSQLFGICSLQSTRMELKPQGFDAQGFGKNAPPNNPFMWQGMRIGERVLGNYGGFDALGIGDIFISNRVRGIDPAGFDAFICDYDYTNFNKRMRVTKSVIEKPKQYVSAVGFVTDDMGVPNIRPAAHYIRPDGNADQYRKGAW